MNDTQSWSLPGSGALPLFGDTDLPTGEPRACVVFLHGYMGYKDYGFIPVLGRRLAERGAVVHRFNFAFSGMTNNTESFERADLFAQQTWNAQVYDTLCVLDGVQGGRLAGKGVPLILLGHSRGGVAAILTAGRHGDRAGLDAVVTMAAPDTGCSMDSASQQAWLASGVLDVRSNRTGQEMAILSRWLEEQIADPAGHSVLGQASHIQVPLLAVHGQADETVSPASATRIAKSAPNGRSALISEANHVFNMPNPPEPGVSPSPAFEELSRQIEGFLSDLTDNKFGS
jgi:uncharacterized protein